MKLGREFHAALVAHDWKSMRALVADDASWTLRGESAVSGRVGGGDAVVERGRRIAGYGLTLELLSILVSQDNVVLSLRQTASREGTELNAHLATVCRIRDGRISEIETYSSDLRNMDRFFV